MTGRDMNNRDTNDQLDSRLTTMYQKRDQTNRQHINQAEIQMRIQDRPNSMAQGRTPWLMAAVGAVAAVAVAAVMLTPRSDTVSIEPAGDSSESVAATVDESNPTTTIPGSEDTTTVGTVADGSAGDDETESVDQETADGAEVVTETTVPSTEDGSDVDSEMTVISDEPTVAATMCSNLSSEQLLSADPLLNAAQLATRQTLFEAALSKDVSTLEELFPAQSVEVTVLGREQTWELLFSEQPNIGQQIAQSLCEGSWVPFDVNEFPAWYTVALNDLDSDQQQQLRNRDAATDLDLMALYEDEADLDAFLLEYKMMFVTINDDGSVEGIYSYIP